MQNIGANKLKAIDDFDRSILRIIQTDNDQTHQQIGDTIGLSGSAVRRRIKRMKEDGIIHKQVALLNPDMTGVTLVAFITFADDTIEAYQNFAEQSREAPEVLQCYHIAGETDFMLVCHVPSLQYYENWSMSTFMTNPAIRRYDTKIIYSCKKFETAIPV